MLIVVQMALDIVQAVAQNQTFLVIDCNYDSVTLKNMATMVPAADNDVRSVDLVMLIVYVSDSEFVANLDLMNPSCLPYQYCMGYIVGLFDDSVIPVALNSYYFDVDIDPDMANYLVMLIDVEHDVAVTFAHNIHYFDDPCSGAVDN